MFSGSQQGQGSNGLTRLVLLKFSHTTASINHNGPFIWNHLAGNGNMIAVFETTQAASVVSTRTVLRVMRGKNILEDIDLSQLMRDAVNQTQSASNRVSKPPFAVLVKSPCLAVKYPRGLDEVRRFQLKFASDHDYYTALAILSGINCPFTESSGSVPQPAMRPPSSSFPFSRPSSSVSAVPDTLSRGGATTFGVSAGQSFVFPSRSLTGVNTHAHAPLSKAPGTGYPMLPSSSAPTLPSTDSTEQAHVPPAEPPDRDHPVQSKLICLKLPTSSSSSRPATALHYHDISALDQILPPKRNLPFSKLGPKISPKAGPRQQPRRAKTASARPTTAGVISQCNLHSSNSRAQENENKTENPKGLERPSPKPAPTKTNQDSSDKGSEIASAQNSLRAPACPQAGPTGTSTTTAVLIPSSHLVGDTVPGNHISFHNQPSSIPSLGADIITTADLSTYISRTTNERAALLENWVCQQIDDDKFQQLCQDVQGVWQRFAFGR